MTQNVKVFYCEESDTVEQRLRVHHDGGGECPDVNGYGYHNTFVVIGRVVTPVLPEGKCDAVELNTSIVENGMIGPVSASDPRWPTHCACGYRYPDDADRQYFPVRLYRRVDTGELLDLRRAPVGAMWHIEAHSGEANTVDGKYLVVKLPGKHDWIVDSYAANCDSPCKHCGVPRMSHDTKRCTNPGLPDRPYTVGGYQDSVPDHKCWVRHGNAYKGEVHVDKNGKTCNAGAGSISVPQYHGFLHNGYLTDVP